MEDKIKELIQAELDKTDKYPQFHSNYEGYAVLTNKIDDLEEDVQTIDTYKSTLWSRVKNNLEGSQKSVAEHIRDFATHAATEAIQVAAMAQKFIDMLEREENK